MRLYRPMSGLPIIISKSDSIIVALIFIFSNEFSFSLKNLRYSVTIPWHSKHIELLQLHIFAISQGSALAPIFFNSFPTVGET